MSKDIRLMQLAFQMVGLEVDEVALDMFLQVKAKFDEKGGDMNVMDCAEIRAGLQEKYGDRRVQYSMDLIG